MATADLISSEGVAPLPPHISDITIGNAVAAEAAAIAKIGADTFTATFGFSVSAEDLDNPALETFVARDPAGRALGMVQLVRDIPIPCATKPATTTTTKQAELRRLYVDTTAHGRGIGSKLIAAVEARARAEGFAKLWLTVWEDNASAQRLYLRLGYEKVGVTDFLTGECVQTDWVLSKNL